MSDNVEKEVEHETGEGTDLWRVILAPVIWAVHFLVCYIAAAVYCEKAGRMADLLPAQLIVGAATLAALGGIAFIFHSLWKVRGVSTVNDNYNYAGSTPEERHRFLSHVALMLCVLSSVAIVYAALPAVFLDICR